MAHRIVALWTVPRTVSTAFERMMIARGDHVVLDEPFSRSYYFGPERRSSRFDDGLPDSSGAEILATIEDAAADRPVFVKDMAYHAVGLLGPELLSRFRNCFLVRDPAATIRSLAARWPDFTDEEAGWEALDRAADVVESLGQRLVVIEADRLCRDPSGVVAAWCAAMDLPFVAEALTWEPGMRPEWGLWSDWHGATAEAGGFRPLPAAPPPPGPHELRLRKAYDRAWPVYRRLVGHALAPIEPQGGSSA